MGLIRAMKSLGRLILVLAMVAAVVACLLLILLNWSSTTRVEFLFGHWSPDSFGAVLALGMAAGLVAGLLLARLPAILRAGKMEKQRREQQQQAKDAKAWREHQKQPPTERQEPAPAAGPDAGADQEGATP
jgi:uncharacterized integral membrane protein